MQQEMHPNESENSGRNIIEDDSGAFWKFLQLPHRRRLDDIEGSEKYKTREKSFPRQRDSDQGDQLTRDFVDDDELGIFGGRGAGNTSGGGDAEQGDHQGQRGGHGDSQRERC